VPAGSLPAGHLPAALALKRLIDLILSALLLVALAPLFAAIALAVKLSSPGPILYRWHVVGERGRTFTGYKFRTMVANADALKAALLPLNEMRGPVFKMRHDPRVTPLGRFLRKHSLDELPQLWSVLRGDTSLVGPRPAFASELARYESWQLRRLSARPGITCLWQVRGRNAVASFDEWVRMDLEYIDNWSLWLDFRILARTVWAVVAGTGR
jgi:lipopolysaccharide/colanic/teichoic acid biosynthesis glycosyltransferase